VMMEIQRSVMAAMKIAKTNLVRRLYHNAIFRTAIVIYIGITLATFVQI
jgi:hypothetical protein